MPNIKAEQKEKARYLYFTTSYSQKSIARVLNITEQTMSAWVREGNWAEEKKLTYYSPEQEIHHLYEELREINNNILKREPGNRFGTKEELETKTKILGLIAAQMKTGGKSRNIGFEVDYDWLNHIKNEREMDKGNYENVM